jgi:peptidoglycan/LPS O-acetylase OafA/YrhL
MARAKTEIPSLTGLRGLAALLVVIGHYSVWTAVTPMAEVPTPIKSLANAAPGIGMSIFFTLSGYVIALSYSHWDWRQRPGFNLVRLFFYRFARLYPAFFVFALLIVMRTPALHAVSDPEVQADVAAHFLLWQSWLPVKYGGVLVSGDWFHVSWSLSTECALYLLFGLGAVVAASLPLWRHKAMILIVAFFATATVLLLAAWELRQNLLPIGWTDGDWLLWLFAFSPWAVSVQFAIGVVAYRLSGPAMPETVARFASELGGMGFVAVYALCTLAIVYHPVTQGLLMALSIALVMIGSQSSSAVNRLLTRPALLYIGTISYSLYLFHFIVPGLAFSGSFETFTGVAAAAYAFNFLFTLALAIALATGLYRLVELPGRRAIRAAADRWLRLSRGPIVEGQGAPAE